MSRREPSYHLDLRGFARSAGGSQTCQPYPKCPTVDSPESWNVERRADGAVLVRVHSRVTNGQALPDAVFAFRAGDPQYSYWEEQLRHRELPPGFDMPQVPMSYS